VTAKIAAGLAACGVVAAAASIVSVHFASSLGADVPNLQAFRAAVSCERDSSPDPRRPTCIVTGDGQLTGRFTTSYTYRPRGSTYYRRDHGYDYVVVAVPGRSAADRVEVDTDFFIAAAVGDRVRVARWGDDVIHVDDVDRAVSTDALRTPVTAAVEDTVGLWVGLVVLWVASVWGGLTIRRRLLRDAVVDLSAGPVSFVRLPSWASRVVAGSWIGLPALLLAAILLVHDVGVAWLVVLAVGAAFFIRKELEGAREQLLELSAEGVRVGGGHGVLQPWPDVIGVRRIRTGPPQRDVTFYRDGSPARVGRTRVRTAVHIVFRHAAPMPVRHLQTFTACNERALATIRKHTATI